MGYQTEREKSQNLMFLLSKNKGEFLYEDIPQMVSRRMPRQVCDKEDMLQGFFADICSRVRTYRFDIDRSGTIHDDRNLKKWIIVCFFNYSANYYKNKKIRDRGQNVDFQRRNIESRFPEKHKRKSDSPPSNVITRELGKTVREGLDQLNPRRRQLVEDYYFKDLSPKEIREKYDITESTLTTQLYLSRRDLKKHLPESARDW